MKHELLSSPTDGNVVSQQNNRVRSLLGSASDGNAVFVQNTVPRSALNSPIDDTPVVPRGAGYTPSGNIPTGPAQAVPVQPRAPAVPGKPCGCQGAGQAPNTLADYYNNTFKYLPGKTTS